MTVQTGLPGFNIEAQAEMLAEFGTSPEGAGYKLPLVCREIGKLENGKPDPCYTCKNIDEACVTCTGYDNYK